MRLARWHRVVATVLAFWLPFVVGEPAIAHPCPMHSPAAMQHDMAHHHDSGPHTPSEPDHHECACIGCCAASAMANGAAAASIVTVVVSQSCDAGHARATTAAPRSVSTLAGLYTTGPPLGALV